MVFGKRNELRKDLSRRSTELLEHDLPDRFLDSTGWRITLDVRRHLKLEAAAVVTGLAIFPELSPEQREQGLTDFNDFDQAQPEAVSRQSAAAVSDTREGTTLRREHAPSMELAR